MERIPKGYMICNGKLCEFAKIDKSKRKIKPIIDKLAIELKKQNKFLNDEEIKSLKKEIYYNCYVAIFPENILP